WSYLKYRQNIPVNKKRIYRLMKENNLLITPQLRRKAKRGPIKPKPKASRPNQFWGIDMTKIRMATWGWLYLTVVLDWHTKEIVGYSLSLRSKTEDWLDALEKAVNNRFPEGIRESVKEQQLFLISDNGCQPTSQRFMANCSILGLKQIFTTWSNPKGNSDTERVMRTIKEDIVWPYDWDNPFEFEVKLNRWINDYNTDYPHQSLNNLTPRQCYEKSINKELVSNLKSA
ncbi:MAG: IS3 family transposase, partial [Candidatus Omnitrophica bacterium]|nr:IS3 family transposase [Candidatus Omnitrophota bacterium]